jgi:hypothetical protein
MCLVSNLICSNLILVLVSANLIFVTGVRAREASKLIVSD